MVTLQKSDKFSQLNSTRQWTPISGSGPRGPLQGSTTFSNFDGPGVFIVIVFEMLIWTKSLVFTLTEDFLKKDLPHFKFCFYFGFLGIPSLTGKQNQKVPFILTFIIRKKLCVLCTHNLVSVIHHGHDHGIFPDSEHHSYFKNTSTIQCFLSHTAHRSRMPQNKILFPVTFFNFQGSHIVGTR